VITIDLWDGEDFPAVSECLICGVPILAGEPEAQRVVDAALVETAHVHCAARRRSWRDAAIFKGDDNADHE
jgi:hypothetical protein